MDHHFNWLYLIPFWKQEHHHVGYMLFAGFLLLVFSYIGRGVLKRSKNPIVPDAHFSFKAFFENFVSVISNLSDLVIGTEGRTFVPFFASIFLFIWVNNVLGLFPGMSAATSNLNTTLALGAFSFLIYNIHGFKVHGITYLRQFMGPVLFLAPLLFVIELVSHLVRPFSLGLRLYGNMLGDHTVLSIFLDLVPLGVPVVFYFLGLFVCTMQAFIFTVLSMVYVSVALSHDH